jgi:triacylglycerol lipase
MAVVAGGAPCDFRHLGENDSTLAYFLGGTRQEKRESYRLASPAEFTSSAAPPIHFFHGSQDGLVPIASSRRLYRQLKADGAPVSYDELKDRGHLATFMDRGAAHRALKFLDEHMQSKSPAPAQEHR